MVNSQINKLVNARPRYMQSCCSLVNEYESSVFCHVHVQTGGNVWQMRWKNGCRPKKIHIFGHLGTTLGVIAHKMWDGVPRTDTCANFQLNTLSSFGGEGDALQTDGMTDTPEANLMSFHYLGKMSVWTVVQTVLTATFNSYGDRQISTLHNIDTPEPIDKNSAHLITSARGPIVPNLVQIRIPVGASGQMGEI